MTRYSFEAIVIGVSAGAVEALSTLLSELEGPRLPPIMIVVHLPPDKKSLMAELFERKCKVSVKEAEDKEHIKARTIYFAPSDYHLLVEADKRLSLSNEEQVNFSRPSIDILFESAAEAYGDNLLGIILTGANQDGAQGLKTVIAAGGTALIELPESAYSSHMPAAARRLCPEAQILALPEMAEYLQKVTLP